MCGQLQHFQAVNADLKQKCSAAENKLAEERVQFQEEKQELEAQHQHAIDDAMEKSRVALQVQLDEYQQAQRIWQARESELEVELASVREQVSALKQKLSEAESSHSEQEQIIQQLRRELDKRAQQLTTLDDELSQARSKLLSLNSELSVAESDAKSAREHASKVEAELASVQADATQAQSTLSQTRSQWQALQYEVDKQHLALQEARLELQAERGRSREVQRSVDEAQHVLAQTKDELSVQKQQVESLRGQLDTARSHVAELELQVVSLQSQLTEWQSKPESLMEAQELANIRSRLQQADADLTAAMNHHAKLQADAQAAVETANEHRRSLEATVVQLRSELDMTHSIRLELRHAQSELALKTSDCERLSNVIAQLQDDSQRAAELSSTQQVRLHESIARLETELRVTADQCSRAESELVQWQQRCQKAEQEIDVLRTRAQVRFNLRRHFHVVLDAQFFTSFPVETAPRERAS